MPTNMPTNTPTPAPTAAHHARLDALIAALEHWGAVAAILAPGVIAPFVHNPTSVAILNAEAPVAQALAATLATPAA